MNRREHGFSLIDVLATVALMGVLVAIAVPTIGTALTDTRANAAIRALQGHLRNARDSAISKRRVVEVQFIGTNEVRTTRLEGTTRRVLQSTVFENGMTYRLTPGVPDTPDALGATAPLNFSGATIVYFQPDGSMTDTTNLPLSGTVFLGTQRTLSARAVTVLGPTGRVTGYRWDGRTWQQM